VNQPSHLTVGKVAEILQAPEWKIRRIVDSLDAKIPRAGLYRLVPWSMLPTIGAKLGERPMPTLEAVE
jgi:hypothetical protein